MLGLRFGEPMMSNPLIDRAPVKPFDAIACRAAAARSEGQGWPDACPSLRIFTRQQVAASRFGRRSLALDGSEQGGKLQARRDRGAYASICSVIAALSASVILALSASIVCAEPSAHREQPAHAGSVVSPSDWSTYIRDAAKRFAIPEQLLRAVMHVESTGDVHAVSSKGAMGLMQIMPPTWEELRTKYRLGDDPYQPRDNIFAGAAYLREMLDRFGRDGFLAAYNAGPARYEAHLATGRPLPRETIDYVRKLTSLIDGAALISARARRGAGRAGALDSTMFTQVANMGDSATSQDERKTDVPVETVFTAIRSASVRAPAGRAVSDLTALVPQPDGSRTKGGPDPNHTIRGLFVQDSSAISQ